MKNEIKELLYKIDTYQKQFGESIFVQNRKASDDEIAHFGERFPEFIEFIQFVNGFECGMGMYLSPLHEILKNESDNNISFCFNEAARKVGSWQIGRVFSMDKNDGKYKIVDDGSMRLYKFETFDEIMTVIIAEIFEGIAYKIHGGHYTSMENIIYKMYGLLYGIHNIQKSPQEKMKILEKFITDNNL
jgi:hypothetical protein